MVLENSSTSPPPNSLDDGAPSSDLDPYSSSNPKTQTFTIDKSSFPKPFPLSRTSAQDKLFREIFAARIQNATNALQRPVNEEEANAFAYWTAKQLSILSYSTPLGLLGGSYAAYRSAGTFRFPFWQPNLEKFRPQVFPPRIGFVNPDLAVLCWHSTRLLAYSFVGTVMGKLLLASYATSVSSVGEISDTRLKEFIDAVRKRAQNRRGELSNTSKSQSGTTGAEQKSPMGRGSNGQQDDASPTGGMYGVESPTGGMFGSESSGSGKQIDSNLPTEARTRRPLPQATYPSQVQMGSPETSEQQFNAFDDDSPTGGQGMAPDGGQEGSAWDRVRKGSSTTTTSRSGSSWPSDRRPQPSGDSAWAKRQNSTQSDRNGSSTDDSFSFSKTDEERSYAKEEAQREFDARVEQERRGGEFSSTSGNQRRW